MNNLSSILTDAGKELLGDEKGKFSVINTLKQRTLPVFQGSGYDANTRFISFFICNLLDDITYNLTGDFPYEDSYGEITHQSKNDFQLVVGDFLVKVGGLIASEECDQINVEFVGLVNSYLTLIDSLNDQICFDDTNLKDK